MDFIQICNNALLLVGANTIGSFLEQSRESMIANAFYSLKRDTMLQQYIWRFSVTQAELSRLVETPLYDYSYAFQLPANAIRVNSHENNPLFKIFGKKLYSNSDSAKITIQTIPNESEFPAYFTNALVSELGATFALAFENDLKYKLLKEEARLEFIKAKSIDSQTQTNSQMPENNFWLTVVR